MSAAAVPLTIADWRRAYRERGARPRELLPALCARLRADDPAWILRCDPGFLDRQLQRLDLQEAAALPLYGVPFAVKDNIDVAGLPTTAACPAFAYTPAASATVVERLLAAGAVLIGKTNLDQFATGLVGTRSPYGEVPNSFDPAYVGGGSSSGSASVVARGLVPLALGTDTAGSGRVPAGLNNLVGLKPTPGSVPMRGVLPACRTLDVVSVFALSVADAGEVMACIEGAGEEPRFAAAAPRPPWFGRGDAPLRVGVPAHPVCDPALGFDRGYRQALQRLRDLGAQLLPVDLAPLEEVAQLLYEGPWVAERYAVVQELIERDPQALDPAVRQVIEAARRHDAVAAFRARYRLEELRQQVAPMWRDIDLLMVPTVPTCPTRAAVAAEPLARNSELGRYTNFVNLLGLAALSVPSAVPEQGLPFGVTFIAPGGSDAALAGFAARWEALAALPLGCRLRVATVTGADGGAQPPAPLPRAGEWLELAVVGAHLQGMPLHGQLLERGARLASRTRTAPSYRLYALGGTRPAKPGMVRVGEGGVAVEIEVYRMPDQALGSFYALVPPPLCLGSVELEDGRWVKGFLCEPHALAGAQDISAHGGWRAWLEATS